MLLDTASLYYRAFYGMPETVTSPDGTPVNAIRGLLDAIARLVKDHQPRRLVACLDADWRPAFRTAAIPEYKQHRAEADGSELTPPGLAVQIPLITQVLIAAGICYVLSAFTSYLFASAELATQLLTIPSILGEVWIMAHLIIVGVHRSDGLASSVGLRAE